MTRVLEIEPATYRNSLLHAVDRNWPETNCYVDLWIEVLHALKVDPAAALGFTVGQDFEGDQFTFFKFLPEDLRALFGLLAQELAIYDTVEAHTVEQLKRGRLVLVEMDSFFLPDTRATSYRREHVKTTVCVNALDVAGKQMGYFHSAGYHALSGEDFDGVFLKVPLYPYVEFVKVEQPPLTGRPLLDEALATLRRHLRQRPKNPIAKFRAELPRGLEQLAARAMDYFHVYTFNTLRQLGANYELLGSHCQWLTAQGEGGLEEVKAACDQLAATAKAFQFQLARAVNKKKFGDFSSTLDTLEQAHEAAVGGLSRRYG